MTYSQSDLPQNVAHEGTYVADLQAIMDDVFGADAPNRGAGATAEGGPLGGAVGASSESGVSPYKQGVSGAGEAPLGNTAKYVGRRAARATRKTLYQMMKRAALLLPGERVSNCRWAVQRNDQPIEVLRHSGGRSSFAGLQTCASVWMCPVCSRRISEQRRKEMNQLLSWSRSQNHKIYMLTLTSRHTREDDLGEQLRHMKGALRRLRQRRDWKKLKLESLVGTVTATEVTHGRAGWHTHFHIIVISRRPIEASLQNLQAAWLRCLETEGLEGVGDYAFKVDRADHAGQYVAKFGAAEEVALGQQKKGRGEGRTPFQLLHDYTFDREAAAGELFREFAQTFKGCRQLIWSDGLREMCGADDVSDEEASGENNDEDELVSIIENDVWTGGARRRRVKILDAAEVSNEACFWMIHGNEIDDEPELAQVIDDDPDPPPRPGPR